MGDRSNASRAEALRNERYERMFGKPRAQLSAPAMADEEARVLRAVQSSASLQRIKQYSNRRFEVSSAQEEHQKQARAARQATQVTAAQRVLAQTERALEMDRLAGEARRAASMEQTARAREDEEARLEQARRRWRQVQEEEEEAQEIVELLGKAMHGGELDAAVLEAVAASQHKEAAADTEAVAPEQQAAQEEAAADTEAAAPEQHKEAAQKEAEALAAEAPAAGEEAAQEVADSEAVTETAAVSGGVAAEAVAAPAAEAEPGAQENAEEPAVTDWAAAAEGKAATVVLVPPELQPSRFSEWRRSRRGQAWRKDRAARGREAKRSKAERLDLEKRDAKLEEMLGIKPAADPLAMMLGHSPAAAPRRRARGSREPEIEFNYNYPTSAQLVAELGPRAEFRTTVLGIEDRAGQVPPRNPNNMVCVRWARCGECEKWETSGWCAFDHPVRVDPEQHKAIQQTERDALFLRAAVEGDEHALWGMLQAGQHVNVVREPLKKHGASLGVPWELASRSALSHAAKQGHLGAMKLLIGKGASLSGNAGEICSPLFAAIIPGQQDKDVAATLELLLQAKADLGETTPEGGQTLLLKAADKRNQEVVPTLLSLKANPCDMDHNGFSALHLATARGSTSTVQRLLAASADPATQASTNNIGPGMSPLGSAARSNNYELMRSLLAAAAPVDASAALYAAVSPSAQCRGLLEDGTPMSTAVNKNGTGVLHVAAHSGTLVAAALERMTADEAELCAARQDNRGVTPLMVAASLASDGTEAMAAVLLLLPISGPHGGCRVQDLEGNTALHHTEELAECTEVVRALLAAGGDQLQEITNNAGQKPMLGFGRECPMQ